MASTETEKPATAEKAEETTTKTAAAAPKKRTAPAKRTTRSAAPKAVKSEANQAEAAAGAVQAQIWETPFTMTKKQIDDATKAMDDMAALARDNMEAMVAAMTAAAKGYEKLGEHFTALSRKQMEDTTALMKALSGAKNAKEAFDLQADFLKSNTEAMVAETAKLSDAALAISKEVSEPITQRMSATMDKFGKAA